MPTRDDSCIVGPSADEAGLVIADRGSDDHTTRQGERTMARTLCRWLMLVALMSVTGTTKAAAECITLFFSPGEYLAAAALVFVGDIQKIETVIPESESEPFFYRVHARVREAYKGIEVGERTFDVQATADDLKLEEGRLMLVYAFGNPRGRFYTQCSPTRMTALNDPELETLRRASAAR